METAGSWLTEVVATLVLTGLSTSVWLCAVSSHRFSLLETKLPPSPCSLHCDGLITPTTVSQEEQQEK